MNIENLVVPFVSEMVEFIQIKGSKARFHSHGKVGRVLEMILNTNSNVLDPCESPPEGDISLAEIKRKVGNQMCIFGNMQLKLLEGAKQDEIKRMVKNGIKIVIHIGEFGSDVIKQADDKYRLKLDSIVLHGCVHLHS